MTQTKLQFQGINGSQTVFVDPSNIATNFSHYNEKLRKNVGSERIPFFRNDFQMNRSYMHKSCGDSCATQDNVFGRVILSGIDADEVLALWSDIKLNVDTVLAAGVLRGIRAPINLSTLVFTPSSTEGV